jgi:hypothetical protein
MSELKTKEDVGAVEVGLGYTKNLGDFNSLRFDLKVRQPVRPGEEWQEAMDRHYDELERKFIEKIREIERELEG